MNFEILLFVYFVTRLSTVEIWSMDSNLVTKPVCVCVCVHFIYMYHIGLSFHASSDWWFLTTAQLITQEHFSKIRVWMLKVSHCLVYLKFIVMHIYYVVCMQHIYVTQQLHIWCDFDRASSLICGNKMPTRCNRGFYCRSYCLPNMFRASLCPSSGAQRVLYSGCCLWYFVMWFFK